MRVSLITPYPPTSRNGNAHTAARYARFLRAAGHRVTLSTEWDGQPAEAMIALHARRSQLAISAFTEEHPGSPLIVVLTGTDLYRDIHVDADAQRSLDLASTLVVLQARGLDELPDVARAKTRVIHQSAPTRQPGQKPKTHFDVCVVAHLRNEKAPFLTAEALACLRPGHHLRVWHIGGELQPGLAEQASRLETLLPGWRWLGPLAHGETRARIGRAHLLVISSAMEGGANVIVEAVTAGTPVLASDIPGNRGMLGEDYAGYFPFGDAPRLAEMLHRAANDADFYAHLTRQCAARAPLFSPLREAAAVRALLS